MTQLLRYLALHARAEALLPLAMAAALAPAAAATNQQRFPIESTQVKAALQTAHFSASGAEVVLLAHLTSTTTEPRFEVSEVLPWGTRSAHVRLVCMPSEECLPFYVAVEWPSVSLARSALLAAGVPASAIDRAEGVTPSSAMAFAPRTTAKTAAEPVDVVRSGSRALLEMDGERLHVQVPVICLESGAAGNTIRVTGLDHRQTYEALVIDGKLLKGRL